MCNAIMCLISQSQAGRYIEEAWKISMQWVEWRPSERQTTRCHGRGLGSPLWSCLRHTGGRGKPNSRL